MSKWHVSWSRLLSAPSAIDAARRALSMLRTGVVPEDLVFSVRFAKKGAHAMDIIVPDSTGAGPDVVADEHLLENLLQAASSHGRQSEPDMEIGDLVDALRVVWKLLTPEAQLVAYQRLVENDAAGWLLEEQA